MTARSIAECMADPDWTPSRDQLAHLIALMLENDDTDLSYRAGYHAGYWARVKQENEAYPPASMRVVTTAREDSRQIYRLRSGVDSVQPRPGDYLGGSVSWDEGATDEQL